MSTQQSRDEAGRWASSQAGNACGASAAAHTPPAARTPASISAGTDPAQRGPGVTIADLPASTNPGSAGMSPAATISHDDDPGNLHAATSALLNRPAGGRGGGGMRGTPVGPPAPPTYGARFRSLGLGGNEVGTQVRTSQGPSQHGRDIPPEGTPGPADESDGGVPDIGGADAADAEAAGAGADLLPLAEAAL